MIPTMLYRLYVPETESAVTSRCDITELLVDQCAHCRNTPTPARGPARRGRWFPARNASDCDGCSAPFDEGDQIRADGEGGWLAECCGDDDD